MTSVNEVNEIIIRQLKLNNLEYDCFFDPEESCEIVLCNDFEHFPRLLDEKCIFSDCTDAELVQLFNAVIERKYLDFDIIGEICKMLPEKGCLVSDKLEKIIFQTEFDYSNYQLLFAYLGCDKKYEAKVIEFLDTISKDFRDGLFIACDRLNTPSIIRKMFEKFTQWISADVDYGLCTGECAALEYFIKKWEHSLPAEDLQPEFLKFKSFVEKNWSPMRTEPETENRENIFVQFFYDYLVRNWLVLRATFTPKLYEIKVVSQEEFSKLSQSSDSEKEFLKKISPEELVQEFELGEAALKEEFSKLPGKWEMAEEYQECLFHCGGIYTHNLISPRYINAIVKAFEKTGHPEHHSYHTAVEMWEEKYPLFGFGEMLLHDRVLYVPDDGNDYTNFF